MKVKLLRKARKRFKIIHLPKGEFIANIHWNFNLYKLKDSTDMYYDEYAQLHNNVSEHNQFASHIFDTEKECINYLLSVIIKRLRYENTHMGSKRKLISNTKVRVW